MKKTYTEKEINGTYTMVYHTKKAAMEYLRDRRQDMKGCDTLTTGSFYIEYEDGSSVMYNEDMIIDETGKVSANGLFRMTGIVAFEEITENSDTVWNCELTCIEMDEKAAEERNAENTEKENETMNTTYIALGIWTDRDNNGMTYTTFTARNATAAAETCKDNNFAAKLILNASDFTDLAALDGRDRIANLFKTFGDIELTAIVDDLFRNYRLLMEADVASQEKFTADLNATEAAEVPGAAIVTRSESIDAAMACIESLTDEKWAALREKITRQRKAQEGESRGDGTYNQTTIVLKFTADELHMLIEQVKKIWESTKASRWSRLLAKLQAADHFPMEAEQAIWWTVTGRIDANCTCSSDHFAANADEAAKLFLQDNSNCTVEKVEPEPIIRMNFNGWMIDRLIEACELSGKTYLIEEIEKQKPLRKAWFAFPEHMVAGLRWALIRACDTYKNASAWVTARQKFEEESYWAHRRES